LLILGRSHKTPGHFGLASTFIQFNYECTFNKVIQSGWNNRPREQKTTYRACIWIRHAEIHGHDREQMGEREGGQDIEIKKCMMFIQHPQRYM